MTHFGNVVSKAEEFKHFCSMLHTVYVYLELKVLFKTQSSTK